jgi:hypothetical protein
MPRASIHYNASQRFMATSDHAHIRNTCDLVRMCAGAALDSSRRRTVR